jgi:sulfide:quinone oxidoreductase
MKEIIILGAGTAGTMMSNHIIKELKEKVHVTIIDAYEKHYYQPGFLFIPFNTYTPKQVIKDKKNFIHKSVDFILSEVEIIEADKNTVKLKDGKELKYDILIIATGCKTVPSELDGLLDEAGWRKNIFDFYTIEGSIALRDFLETWKGGKLVLNIAEMPIKCPVAPLEFLFLADDFLTKKGIRDKCELILATPLSGAFTKQNCSNVLGYMLDEKNIKLESEYNISEVIAKENKIISYDDREISYDLLVSIPPNMGDDLIGRSNLGDELNFVPTNKNTLQSKSYKNIFVIGDATDLPASKAGSVAHFEGEVLIENLKLFLENKELKKDFDGHANCFIESGFGKAFLIDFNYDLEPVQGKFPLASVGPFKLLKETRINHWGKLAFRHIYWGMLLKAKKMPFVTAKMQMKGKVIPKDLEEKYCDLIKGGKYESK